MSNTVGNVNTSDFYQYIVAAVVSLLSIGYGITIGWASPNGLILMSDESPLPTGKITLEEVSFIASLINLGGLIGNIIYGFATSQFGRKNSLLFLAIPTIISWTLILYAQNVYMLYIARVLNGFVGGGISVAGPVFLSEIASDRIRGMLTSTVVFGLNFGVLLEFIIGHYCDYYTTPRIVIVMTCLFAVLLAFFPESPMFLMKQSKLHDAINSIRFYKNLPKGDVQSYDIIQSDIDKLKSALDTSKTANKNKSIEWSDLVSKEARRALIIGIVLAALNQCCGCFALLTYTAQIFEDADTRLSPNMSAIIVGLIQFVGTAVSVNLVDLAGRKFLYVVSTVGTSVGLITFGVYMQLKSLNVELNAVNWIPIASFSFVMFIASWAVLPMPYVLIPEILPEKIKDLGVTLCMMLIWLLAFIMVKFLPFFIEALGHHGTMYAFGGVCLFSTFFIVLYVPETKGKSYEEIMRSLQ